MAGPTPNPFSKAFACAVIAFVVIVVAAVSTLGLPADSGFGSELLGRLVAYVSMPALVVGFFARRSAKVWSIWKIIAVYILLLVVVLVVLIANVVSPAKPPA